MATLALPTDDDFPAAAAKHLQDALLLLREDRYDNAGYLAGYVVECVTKTLILLEQGTTAWGHRLDELSRKALQLAALPGARTARYATAMTPGHAIYDYGNTGWSEGLRYRAASAVSADDATAWLQEAKKVYDEVVVSLRLDGVLS